MALELDSAMKNSMNQVRVRKDPEIQNLIYSAGFLGFGHEGLFQQVAEVSAYEFTCKIPASAAFESGLKVFRENGMEVREKLKFGRIQLKTK